jgi:hypothetical protein
MTDAFDEFDDLDDLSDFDDVVVPENTSVPENTENTVNETNADTEADRDNINPDIDNLSWSDEDPEDPEDSESSENDTSAVKDDLWDEKGEKGEKAKQRTTKKKMNPREKKLLEKYEDLEVDDPDEIAAMAELMNDRRAFSERLENDPEFRAKYIVRENARRKKLEEDEADDIIGRLQQGEYGEYDEYDDESGLEFAENDSDIMRELEDLDDIAGHHSGSVHVTKPGVFIQHVDKIVIHMNFT